MSEKTLYHDLFASSSGYGYMKHIDCNSALALIGLILFLDILRDLVEDITTQRRKRSVERFPQDLLHPFQNGTWPIASNLILNSIDTFMTKDDTLEKQLCIMNKDMTKFGNIGRVMGIFMSNILGKAKSTGQEHMDRLLTISQRGRLQHSCDDPGIL